MWEIVGDACDDRFPLKFPRVSAPLDLTSCLLLHMLRVVGLQGGAKYEAKPKDALQEPLLESGPGKAVEEATVDDQKVRS